MVAVFKCYTNERIELDENEAVGADYLTRDDVDEIVFAAESDAVAERCVETRTRQNPLV